VQAQRVTCAPGHTPPVEDWHRGDGNGVVSMAIVCVARYNVRGGISEFRLPHAPGEVVRAELAAGFMAVFDDAPIQHRVTPIEAEDGATGGHRDVLLFSRLSAR
jgi:hypothetical protein